MEFTKGEDNPDYLKLTSLLHIKDTTTGIQDDTLFEIYKNIFGDFPANANPFKGAVLDLVFQEADSCLNDGDSANFENKIVLSIAVRLRAEQYMLRRINDSALPGKITGHQTTELLNRLRKDFPDDATIATMDRIILTPKNIHLNYV
ncbi:MAG: hypothetical protein OXC68_14210 [Aestuariivita sp.]|nr:hypothetical protein [Aestuariivita sp.]